MDLLRIFRSDRNGERRSHIKNLVLVAMADGHLDDDEWQMLVAIARLLETSEEEILSIKNNPESVKFVPPKKYDEKVQQIQDLVAIMTVDDEINSREIQLCKKISLKLDILPQLVDDIINDIHAKSSH